MTSAADFLACGFYNPGTGRISSPPPSPAFMLLIVVVVVAAYWVLCR